MQRTRTNLTGGRWATDWFVKVADNMCVALPSPCRLLAHRRPPAPAPVPLPGQMLSAAHKEQRDCLYAEPRDVAALGGCAGLRLLCPCSPVHDTGVGKCLPQLNMEFVTLGTSVIGRPSIPSLPARRGTPTIKLYFWYQVLKVGRLAWGSPPGLMLEPLPGAL